MDNLSSESQPLFLSGPTASGKSALAMNLARRLNGEIISVDSMQVYRGLDIGTAKPSLSDRERVPHHLIDVAGLDETFDAARFIELARRAAESIQSRGKVPIFCGGTGLYFKGYLMGLGEGPKPDPRLRAELEQRSLSELLEELRSVDSKTYQSIDRQNRRRVLRAVEVVRLAGRSFSECRTRWTLSDAGEPEGLFLFLNPDRTALHKGINERVDRMIENGWVEETRALWESGLLAANQTAGQAIGYRQLVDYLQGRMAFDETVERIKIRTRQYAKRQMTWFRGQMQARWIPVDDAMKVSDLAELALRYRREWMIRHGGSGAA